MITPITTVSQVLNSSRSHLVPPTPNRSPFFLVPLYEITNGHEQVRTCLAKSSAVAPLIESLLPAAVAEAGKRGLEIVGPPLSGYYSWDPKEGGETSFTTGPMVAGDSSTEEAAKDDTGLGFRSLGGVKCVTVTHVGPYDELGKCYEATLEWIAAKGYEDKCPVTEIYENDPKDTEPAKLRTKVSVPIVLK